MDNPNGILPPGLAQFQLPEPDKTQGNSELGQDAFFELMVTQLQNQDPFKPMESGDFLGQIAQFSTVSGIGDLQKSFATLASSMQSNQALQASTMVGREVVIPRSAVTLGADGEVALSGTLGAAAGGVKLTIADAAGQVVRQVAFGPMAAGPLRYTWDGLDDAGHRAAPGSYSIKLEANIGGQVEGVETAVRARVDSVSLSRAGLAPTLNVNGLGVIDMAEVIEIL